jgi:hypothetical protein
MKNNFLPLALAILCSALASAQNPVSIPVKTTETGQNQAENICNEAGTVEVAQFIGQSNDTDLYQIFLCFGDSILIDHQGDADLSGDPNTATLPGIGYVFYNCPPSITGPTLSSISNDPCILEGSSGTFFSTQGIPNDGETWFFNNGSMQNTFNGEQPISIFFAPVTLDNYVSNVYESAQPGTPPGPCVDANIEEAFEVVYLNKINATSIDNNFGNDCVGRFTARGGYPQYEPSETYDIDISLSSDSDVKGLLMTGASNLFHLVSVPFSVCQPGLYTVNIEDGKSCGHSFQIDMSGCNAADNVGLDFGEVAGLPGDTVCVPLQVTNFNVLSSIFSITWNPALLHFTEISQINPAIATQIDPNFMNTSQVSAGVLGLLFFNTLSVGTPLQVPDGESLFEICFEVLDTTSSDIITIGTSSTSGVSMENSQGQLLGVCTTDGGVFKPVATTDLDSRALSKTFPNPVRAGEPASLDLLANKNTTAQLILHNAQGARVQVNELELTAGENRIALPTSSLLPGIYFIMVCGPNAILASAKVVILSP